MSKSKQNLSNVYTDTIRAGLSVLFEFLPEIHNPAELESRTDLRDVEVIFSTWGMFSPTAEEIRKYLPKIKHVFYGAGTVQGFARPFLEVGATVHSAWAANAVPVAEFTVAQIILANKGYFQRFYRQGSGEWTNRKTDVFYTGNYNNKVGLIGIGMIGSLVAEMLKAYELDVLAFDPFLPKEKAKALGLRMASLEEIFSSCTVISNHLANNAQTVGLLSAELFAKMNPNATFINTGRGAQVDEDGLISAMEAEPNRIALLDVTYPEPPEKGSKLYELPNVFLSPHIAGSLGDEVGRMGKYMYEEAVRVINGEAAKWSVSEKMLETMA